MRGGCCHGNAASREGGASSSEAPGEGRPRLPSREGWLRGRSLPLGGRAGLCMAGEGPVRRLFYGPVPRGYSLWGHFHHCAAAANSIPGEVSDHRHQCGNKDLRHRVTTMGLSLSAEE